MHHGKLDKLTARGLQELRRRLKAAKIPSSKLDETLLLATWNVRELGKDERLPASLHYIAEVIGQFDVVALVELRDNVGELHQVLRYLGPYWRVVYSDYLTDAGGNRERIAYVYDERAAVFTGLASVAEQRRAKGAGGDYLPEGAWWRRPYLASFRAGNFDFVLVTAHIRWAGSAGKRVGELTALANWVHARTLEEHTEDKDVIVLGDFNVPGAKSPLYQALTSRGLRMPTELMGLHGSNLAKDKRYDQILHHPRHTKGFTGRGGVVDFYVGDHAPLFPGRRMSKEAFTYELSDHLPLWMELNTDHDEEELDQVLERRSCWRHEQDQSLGTIV